MRINKIKRKFAKMMKDLPDHELMACIYMLCCELMHRSGDTITLNNVLSSVWNIGRLVYYNSLENEEEESEEEESEDEEC